MSGFFEKILSGKYPEVEKLWTSEFGKIVDELFGSEKPGPDDYVDDIDDVDDDAGEAVSAGLRADVDRLEALVLELRQRCDQLVREVGVVKAERNALQYKLDSVRDVVRSRFHEEPLG